MTAVDTVDVGPYLEDHITAMLQGQYSRAAVLASALRRHFGGQRLLCERHGIELTFAELVSHATRLEHDRGDVVPAPPDPRDRGRGGEPGTAP